MAAQHRLIMLRVRADVGHDRGEDAFLVLRGEGRRAGGPADDADGPLEFDPVRVDARFGDGPADQGRQGVMSEQGSWASAPSRGLAGTS
jgi:hypothetical protein